jgi:hypothetical protein
MNRIPPILIALVLCAPVQTLYAWGPLLHQDINRAAAEWAPEEMAAWRAYAGLMADHASDPDAWRGYDAGEGPRHYIDLEMYGDPAASPLTRDRSQCAQGREGPVPVDAGIAPWVILELQDQLTRAMRDGDWHLAARVAAAQGHYVADSHQPLHCTENHNGQYTGNMGIHARWEDRMPTNFWNAALLRPQPVEEVPDLWPVISGWITAANARVAAILLADSTAREATGGMAEGIAYYESMWDGSREVMIDQASRAAAHLASLWYTAWRAAGSPAIPPPPETMSSDSIFPVVPKPNRPPRQ